MMSPAASEIDVVRSFNQTECPSHRQFMISAQPCDFFVLLHKITKELHGTGWIGSAIHKVTYEHDPPFMNIRQSCQLCDDFTKLRCLTVYVADYGHGTFNTSGNRCHFT